MSDLTIMLSIGVGGIVVFAGLGAWIAKQKRREPFEGLLLGGIFGPLGVLIEALLPSGDRRAGRRPSESDFWSKPPEPTWLRELDGQGDGPSDWLQDLERKSRGK